MERQHDCKYDYHGECVVKLLNCLFIGHEDDCPYYCPRKNPCPR